MTTLLPCRAFSWRRCCFVVLLMGLGLPVWLGATARSAHCEPQPGAVQVLTERLDPGERAIYHVPNLKRGDTLYLYMQRLSDNLAPLFAVADGHFEITRFDDLLQAKLRENSG